MVAIEGKEKDGDDEGNVASSTPTSYLEVSSVASPEKSAKHQRRRRRDDLTRNRRARGSSMRRHRTFDDKTAAKNGGTCRQRRSSEQGVIRYTLCSTPWPASRFLADARPFGVWSNPAEREKNAHAMLKDRTHPARPRAMQPPRSSHDNSIVTVRCIITVSPTRCPPCPPIHAYHLASTCRNVGDRRATHAR